MDQNMLKNVDLASLNSEVDKLDIRKLKNIPSNLNNMQSKVDKLIPDPVDLSKQCSGVVKMMLLKKIHIMLRQKVLKIKYLIFLT